MAVTLNASTSSGFIATSDTSGSLELQANGTTKATVGSTGLSIGQYNPAASLITSGTAVASTSGTSIDFTSIPSWVKRITVMLNNVSTNGSSNLLLRLGTSSGIEATNYVGSESTIVGVNSGSFTKSISVGFDAVYDYGNLEILSGQYILSYFGSNIWICTWMFGHTSGARMQVGGGSKALSGTLDRIRFTTVNGTDTFDNGSINILYE